MSHRRPASARRVARAAALLALLASAALAGCATALPVPAPGAPPAVVTSIARPAQAPSDPRRVLSWSTPAVPGPLLTRSTRPGRIALGEGPERGFGAWWRDPAPAAVASRAATLGLGIASAGVLAWGGTSLRDSTGDVLQFALPGAAGATAALQQDWKGLRQFGLSLGATFALARATKALVSKDRPDGGRGDSFPSAHTASAFAGAAFLQQRYGLRLGLPAFVLAAHTAATRVAATRHYVDDVLAGAGLGLLTTWLLVDPTCDDDPATCRRREGRRRRLRVAFAYAAVFDTDDEARSPGDGGDTVNLSDLRDETEKVAASARLTVEWWPAERHVISAVVDPVDITDDGVFATPRSFGGRTFAPGQPVVSTHHHHRYQLAWRYALSRERPLRLDAGAGLLLTDYRATLAGGGQRARVQRLHAMPVAQLVGHLDLLPALSLRGDASAGAYDDSWFVDLGLQLLWQVDARWDVALGVHALKARTDDEEFANRLDVFELFVAFGRSF